MPGPLRFNAVEQRLQGITQRVLTQTLRKLERSGMLRRRIREGSPPGVEYALTPLGRALQEPLGVRYEWTLAHLDTIQKRQETCDSEAAIIARRRA